MISIFEIDCQMCLLFLPHKVESKIFFGGIYVISVSHRTGVSQNFEFFNLVKYVYSSYLVR